jgi:uncharacterized protein affecting Mg2+/Co2+ transport
VDQDSKGVEEEQMPKGSPGVVGQQPTLRMGDRVAYTSGAYLPDSEGHMYGSFQMMLKDSGELFDALIHPFKLRS